MSPKFHRNSMGIGSKSRSDFFYFYLFRKLLSLKNLNNLLIVDPLLKEYLNKFNFKSLNKIIFFNEPINLTGHTTKEKARDILGIPTDSNVILIYGDISKRKGVIQITNSIKLLNKNFLLLIAGTINSDLKEFFESVDVANLKKENKLLISNGFKNEIEQYNYFISSDIISVAYESSFTSSSGVYYQACSIGKPVLVNKCGLLYWLVKKYNNGIAINLNDTKSIANDINILFNDKNNFISYSNQSTLIAKRHSAEQFMNSILKAIK
jgi:glycosyltransferase involved in cell wall biosynthesis